MTPEEHKRKVESYGQAHDLLVEALRQFPREMWTFKSSEGWSIHEIIVHITDSEANSFVRCRRLLAEPGSAVLGYDENRWAKALRYEDQSPEDALELFKWLRRASYNLIKARADSAAGNVVHHSENGPMTFDDWLDTYERHIPDHVAQMQRAYEEWRAAR